MIGPSNLVEESLRRQVAAHGYEATRWSRDFARQAERIMNDRCPDCNGATLRAGGALWCDRCRHEVRLVGDPSDRRLGEVVIKWDYRNGRRIG